MAANLKILIIRLSAIGDTIHCLPVAAALKERMPGCHIGWLVESPAAPLVIGNPAVDQVFVLPKKAWLKGVINPWRLPGLACEIGGFWASVRQSKFDVALDLQGLLKSAVCAVASGAGMRVGFASARECSSRFLTECLDVGDYFSPYRHIVDLNVSLVDFLCQRIGIADSTLPEPMPQVVASDKQAVAFPLPEPPIDSIVKINNLLGLNPASQGIGNMPARPVAVLIPGTTWSSKLWELDNWYLLAKRINQELNYRICLAGGVAEVSANGQLSTGLSSEIPQTDLIDLTGQTSLLDLIALFRSCDLVVGVDTGPLHLAAAVGRPKVLGIYGSTPSLRNGPYGNHCRSVSLQLWCQPCFAKVCPLSTLACLKELSVEKVFLEITQVCK